MNCICPEYVDTAMVRQNLADLSSDTKDYMADMGLIRCAPNVLCL